MTLPDVAIELVVTPSRAPDRDMRIQLEGHDLDLAPAAWSDWLLVDSLAGPIHLRARRLDDDALFITPAFQDPGRPIHPYTSSPTLGEDLAGSGMYVVEPTGWRSVDDPALREGLFEHLVDIEEQHLRGLFELIERVPQWRLLVHVITLPDRTSHAFWRYHEPDAYPPLPPGELAASRSKVEDAYRESDRLLGALLERVGPETTVLVVSDHGSASGSPPYGAHRRQGILIAAGAGLSAGGPRLQLEIADVTPLSLALLGLPQAEDLRGELPGAMLSRPASGVRIATYESERAVTTSATPEVNIDDSTRDQLRGLGYVE